MFQAACDRHGNIAPCVEAAGEGRADVRAGDLCSTHRTDREAAEPRGSAAANRLQPEDAQQAAALVGVLAEHVSSGSAAQQIQITLRPRQELFVKACLDVLEKHGSALGVAPTGAGKTICLSAICKAILDRRPGVILWLQHRLELLTQNLSSLQRAYPDIAIARVGPRGTVIGASQPRVVFGMVQTVFRHCQRPEWISRFGTIAAVLIDEAHHSAAPTYRAILRAAGEGVWRVGVTATPKRADGQGYDDIFPVIADQVTLEELVESKLLVEPIGYVLAYGDGRTDEELQDLIARGLGDDMETVAELIDHPELCRRVVEKWRERSGDRQTVVFCSTVAHAQHVAQAFREHGVSAEFVHGGMPKRQRKAILDRFDKREVQVLTNASLLTEGWDCQPVSCIVLLRPCSSFSTLVQMIGRGLRPVDPRRYPGVTKTDCHILDFGRSLLVHENIVRLYHIDDIRIREKSDKDVARHKKCRWCGAENPLRAVVCQQCGIAFTEAIDNEAGTQLEQLPEFVLIEKALLKTKQKGRWHRIGDASLWVLDAIEHWGAVIGLANGQFVGVIGDGKNLELETAEAALEIFKKVECALLSKGADFNPKAKWYTLPATDAQRKLLQQMFKCQLPKDLDRYSATCLLRWFMVRKKVEHVMKLRGLI